MTIRSSSNKRVQNREYTGASRKSAASAKPARAAASSVRVVPASSKARRREREQGESLEGLSREEKRARRRELRVKEDNMLSAANILMKEDDEYRSKRRIFWALIGIGVVGIALEWLLLMGTFSMLPEDSLNVISIVGIIASYAFVIASFVYDMVKIRPIRNFYKAQVSGMADRRVVEVIEKAAEKSEKEKSAKKRGFKKRSADANDAGASTAQAETEGPVQEHKKKRPKKNQRSRR